MFMFPDRSLADISTVALFILISAKHTSEETIQSNDYFLAFFKNISDDILFAYSNLSYSFRKQALSNLVLLSHKK